MSIADVKREISRKMGPSPEEAKPEVNPSRCTATGCPQRWSCDMGKGKLCSWHDKAPRRAWDEITFELQELHARGVAPVYPQLAQAAWVKLAAQRARSGPHGADLSKAMRRPDLLTDVEIAKQKRNTQHMVDQLAQRVERT